LILDHGEIGETYCVGGSTEAVNNLMVVKKIIEILGADESAIEFVKDRPSHDRRYAIDWSKAKEKLGYEPAADFDQYLTQTVEWYKNNQHWWQEIKSGDYREYYQKQYGGK